MFSDHGPRPFQGNLKPKEYLTGIQGLIPTGKDRNAAAVSNGRGSLYLYIRNPDDESSWNRTTYQKLRDYQGQDILATIADKPEALFVICNREEGDIAILSKEGEATLSAVEGGFLYRLTWGKDSLGMNEIEGRVISARELLEKTYDKPFPYPLQWVELLQAPYCGDVMIVVDKYAFFWDQPWVITTHGGPSRDEISTSLLAIGPRNPAADIRYGRQITFGSVRHLYNSLCRILFGRVPPFPWAGPDLLFDT